MTHIPYSYGGFILHDNLTYFVEGVDFSWVPVTVTTAKIARLEGMKKAGDTVDMRQIPLIITVMPALGTRQALESALDALYIALNQRQQQLILHADGRYFLADCVSVSVPVKKPAYAIVQAQFTCYQPFAFAALPSSALAPNISLSGTGPYNLTTTIVGGGTVFVRPTVTVTNVGSLAISNLVLLNQAQNQSLTISSLTLNQNDYVTIVSDPNLANGYTITKNGVSATLYDFTGAFPIQGTGGEAWQMQCTASSTPIVTVQWNWTKRYLG